MTLVFGRRRLIISLTSEQSEPVPDQYPMAYLATDHELARLNKLGIDAANRVRHEFHRVLYGTGWIR